MKKVICSEKAPGAIGPYSQAIEANGMIFVSGQLPIDAATGKMAEGIEEQARQSLENIKHILEEAGLTMGNIVKTTVFLQDMSFFAGMNGVYATYFDGAFPARSAVAVKALPKDALVEIGSSVSRFANKSATMKLLPPTKIRSLGRQFFLAACTASTTVG